MSTFECDRRDQCYRRLLFGKFHQNLSSYADASIVKFYKMNRNNMHKLLNEAMTAIRVEWTALFDL